MAGSASGGWSLKDVKYPPKRYPLLIILAALFIAIVLPVLYLLGYENIVNGFMLGLLISIFSYRR
jgi:hypothetical protein